MANGRVRGGGKNRREGTIFPVKERHESPEQHFSSKFPGPGSTEKGNDHQRERMRQGKKGTVDEGRIRSK